MQKQSLKIDRRALLERDLNFKPLTFFIRPFKLLQRNQHSRLANLISKNNKPSNQNLSLLTAKKLYLRSGSKIIKKPLTNCNS